MAEINNPVNVNYSTGDYRSFNVHPAFKVYKKDYTNINNPSGSSEVKFTVTQDLLYMDSTNELIDLEISFKGTNSSGVVLTRTFTIRCKSYHIVKSTSTGTVVQDLYYIGKVDVGGTAYGEDDIDPEYGNAPLYLKGIVSGYFVANQPYPTTVFSFGGSVAVSEISSASVWFVPKDMSKANATANRFEYEILNINEATEISDIIIQAKNGEDNLFLVSSSTVGLFDKTSNTCACVSGMSTSNLNRIGLVNNALIYRPVTVAPSFHPFAQYGHIRLNFGDLYKVGIGSPDELLEYEYGVYPVKISLLGQNLNLSPDIEINLINIEDIMHT